MKFQTVDEVVADIYINEMSEKDILQVKNAKTGNEINDAWFMLLDNYDLRERFPLVALERKVIYIPGTGQRAVGDCSLELSHKIIDLIKTMGTKL